MSERGTSINAAAVTAHWRTILLVIVAALGAGVLAALILTQRQATSQRDRALDLQSHSYEVMILTRSLSGTMARAEATLGRFVISGDRAIGQQYSDEWISAGQQIDKLDWLTNDRGNQQRRVDALRAAYRERGDELNLIALSTRYKQNNQALSRFWQARESASLRRVGRLLDNLIATERALLAQRTRAATATIERSNTLSWVLSGFGILIVLAAIALAWMTVKALAGRAIAAAEAERERERVEELEAAVATATAELHEQAREREEAEARLRQVQKLDAVGQLTGGIAHDFNNMLAVVLGGIELAKRRYAEGDPDVPRHLESAAEGATRASALTRRLLAFARSEPLAPRATDPGDLIRGMSDLLDRTIGDGIRIVTRDDSAGSTVWVDRHGLENAILNLAVNARDAMDGRGTLTIATGRRTLGEGEIGRCQAGDYVTISVSDTGCGMPPEVVERALEPFFTTKGVGRGTGLGLSQIFGFVQESEGDIAIDSTVGKGSTITLYLPRHAGEAAGADDGVGNVEPFRRAASSLDIFVVEDDPRVLGATMELLTELGHRPVACPDPMLAAARARDLPAIDLVMSDVLMPGKTGPEVVAEIVAERPNVAVLFVTGFAGEAGVSEGFGGHGVLRKPFTLAALSAAIQTALDDRDEGDALKLAVAG